MSRRIRFGALLLAAALLLGGLASAQTTPAPPAGGTGGQRASLQALERQAARLTLVNSMPEADRAEASRLLDRADALRQRARSLRTDELQAYVAALQAGDAPMTARVQAQQKVADTRLALTKDMASLRSDVQAFVHKVPQARALLRELAAGGRSRIGMGGPGTRGFGMRGFGMPGLGMPGLGMPGPGHVPGMRSYPQGGMGWRGNERDWPGGSGMPQAGQRLWGPQDNGMTPRGPRSGQPWSGTPQNSAPQDNTPQNNTPQNNTPQTPPASGSGSGS